MLQVDLYLQDDSFSNKEGPIVSPRVYRAYQTVMTRHTMDNRPPCAACTHQQVSTLHLMTCLFFACVGTELQEPVQVEVRRLQALHAVRQVPHLHQVQVQSEVVRRQVLQGLGQSLRTYTSSTAQQQHPHTSIRNHWSVTDHAWTKRHLRCRCPSAVMGMAPCLV